MSQKVAFILETVLISLPIVVVTIWAGWTLSHVYLLSDFFNVQLMIDRGISWVQFIGVGYAFVLCLIGLLCGLWLSAKYIFGGEEGLRSCGWIPFFFCIIAALAAALFGVLGLVQGDRMLMIFLIGLLALVPFGHLVYIWRYKQHA